LFESFCRQKAIAYVGLLLSIVLEAHDQEISVGEITSHQEHVMWGFPHRSVAS